MTLLQQLVVGGARDYLDLQLRDRIIVDDPAERARREDVRFHAVDLIGLHGARTEIVHHALHALGVDVGHHELRARLVQLPGQIVAHVPRALHRDGLAGERIGAPVEASRRLHRPEDTVRRHRRRVARLAREAGDVVGFHVHELHVARARAHVLRRDVPATLHFHEPAVCAEDHLARLRAVVADDHGLAATEVQPRDGVLVSHPPRQSQRVDNGLFIGGVAPEARPAERGAERGAVYGDDPSVSRRRIAAEHELLVPHLGDPIEDSLLGSGCGDLGYGHGLENGLRMAIRLERGGRINWRTAPSQSRCAESRKFPRRSPWPWRRGSSAPLDNPSRIRSRRRSGSPAW